MAKRRTRRPASTRDTDNERSSNLKIVQRPRLSKSLPKVPNVTAILQSKQTSFGPRQIKGGIGFTANEACAAFVSIAASIHLHVSVANRDLINFTQSEADETPAPLPRQVLLSEGDKRKCQLRNT